MTQEQYRAGQTTQSSENYQKPKTAAEVKKKLGAPSLDHILDDIGAAVEKDNLSKEYRQQGGQ